MTSPPKTLPPAGDDAVVSSVETVTDAELSLGPSRKTKSANSTQKYRVKTAAMIAKPSKTRELHSGTVKPRRPRKATRYREMDNPDEPERIAFLRRHWRTGAYTLEELQQMTGLTLRQIEIIAEQEKFPKRLRAKPALSRNRSSWCGKTCPGLQRCPERGVMVSRLFGAVEREIGRFERLAQDDAPSADIRVLGALTSTLDKLFALDRDFLSTPDDEASPHAAQAPAPNDPYAPAIAQRIRDAIAQALDGIGDKP